MNLLSPNMSAISLLSLWYSSGAWSQLCAFMESIDEGNQREVLDPQCHPTSLALAIVLWIYQRIAEGYPTQQVEGIEGWQQGFQFSNKLLPFCRELSQRSCQLLPPSGIDF